MCDTYLPPMRTYVVMAEVSITLASQRPRHNCDSVLFSSDQVPRKAAKAKHTCAVGERLVPIARPGCAAQQKQRRSNQESNREDEKADAIFARAVLDRAKQGRQEEATESAGGPDQSSNDTYLLGETLRHELENGAIPHPEHSHADEQKRDEHR